MSINENDMEKLRNMNSQYSKLFGLVIFECQNQEKLYKICSIVNSISSTTYKNAYLLYCYFEYCDNPELSTLNYIGISDEIFKMRIGNTASYYKKFFEQVELFYDQNKIKILNPISVHLIISELNKSNIDKFVCENIKDFDKINFDYNIKNYNSKEKIYTKPKKRIKKFNRRVKHEKY